MPGKNCVVKTCTKKSTGGNPCYVILLILVLVFPLAIPAQAESMALEDSSETLYINSNLKWATAYIEFPEAKSTLKINPNSVKISHIDGKALASPIYKEGPSGIGDKNDNGTPDLMINFDMKKLARLLDAGRRVELTYSGKMRSGESFTGRSIVMIVGNCK